MPPLALLSGRDVAKVFVAHGWRIVRQRGSHIILTREGDMLTLSVPDHDEVARGLIRAAGLTVEQFNARI